MFKFLSQPINVIRKNNPRSFTGRDGAEHNAYSVLLLDDIYPVRVSCTQQVYESVYEGCEYQFQLGLSFYNGKPSVKLVEVV